MEKNSPDVNGERGRDVTAIPVKGEERRLLFARFLMMKKGTIYVGTSGWSYKDWAKEFYPRGLPASRQFEFYRTKFPTVEINATFYRLPTEKAVQTWHSQAPPGFVYSVKGSRAVTHYKRLLPGARSFDILLDRAARLGANLGPLLWQLPGSFKKDLARLTGFLEILPADRLHAIEFRHPSWLDETVFAVLRERNVASVSVSSLAMPMVTEMTAGFGYVRFHGLEGGAAHDYVEAELKPWADFLRKAAAKHHDVFVYFNNDVNTRAPENALLLMRLVGTAAMPAAASG